MVRCCRGFTPPERRLGIRDRRVVEGMAVKERRRSGRFPRRDLIPLDPHFGTYISVRQRCSDAWLSCAQLVLLTADEAVPSPRGGPTQQKT